MRLHPNNSSMREDRYLLVDDTDEDASALLTIICDGDPRSKREIGRASCRERVCFAV